MDEQQGLETAVWDEASLEYLGRWNRLVSTTNWEKGRIILDWRLALIDAGAAPAEYSDEAWSRRVGNVSGQHVGRLRRVAERFGHARDQFAGVYWSHFQAALDWDDAEMWLEGAVQSGWSVAQMRAQRWEALGAPADQKPRDEDAISSEMDEDYEPLVDEQRGEVFGSLGAVRDAEDDEPMSRERSGRAEYETGSTAMPANEEPPFDAVPRTIEATAPFAHLNELPDDLADAFETFKLAILRHKVSGWAEVSRDDVLASVESLRELILAPSDD